AERRFGTHAAAADSDREAVLEAFPGPLVPRRPRRREELDGGQHDQSAEADQDEPRGRNREPLERILRRAGSTEARRSAPGQEPEHGVAKGAAADRNGNAAADEVSRPTEHRKQQDPAQRGSADRTTVQVSALVIRPALVD